MHHTGYRRAARLVGSPQSAKVPASTGINVGNSIVFEAFPLTPTTLMQIRPLYQAFSQVAQRDYGWPYASVDFTALGDIFANGMMHGYVIQEVVDGRVVGFMFYQIEPYRALEIKVIYLEEDVPVKVAMDTLFNRFIEGIRPMEGWDVASYALLGVQRGKYIPYITWYGFKPVGQAVVRFHLFDGITVEIFKKQQFAPLPPGYRFISWDPRYEQGVIDVLAESFAESVDALWDPRFRTREGMTEALDFVTHGGYGLFWPKCNTILLDAADNPVGVCLFNVVSAEEANIPLIGLLKSQRKLKLGKTLLAHTVDQCIHEVLNGNLMVQNISATVATSNIPAIRMYRHTGFQEDHWYPHVYQDRNSVLKRKAGQWC